jgi:hypothetical protein
VGNYAFYSKQGFWVKTHTPRRMNMKKNLVIKSNNCSCKEPCAICGEVERHAEIPIAIFLEGTYDPK